MKIYKNGKLLLRLAVGWGKTTMHFLEDGSLEILEDDLHGGACRIVFQPEEVEHLSDTIDRHHE